MRPTDFAASGRNPDWLPDQPCERFTLRHERFGDRKGYDLDRGNDLARGDDIPGRNGRDRDGLVDSVESVYDIVDDGEAALRGDQVDPAGKGGAGGQMIALQHRGNARGRIVFGDIVGVQACCDHRCDAGLAQRGDIFPRSTGGPS